MKPRLMFAALVGTVLLIGISPAVADTDPQKPPEKQAAIPFVNSGSIRDYRVVDNDTLYIQDIGGKWYRADLIGNCLDLPYAQAIGFDARGTNSFDRFSSIIVRGRSCPLTSLVESAPPPKKARKH